MIVVGLLGKVGAVFVSIPDPIVGGIYMVMFGMIAAVGISNLQFADMNSSRNLFIVGFSIVFGLALPYYMEQHPKAIETGMLFNKVKESKLFARPYSTVFSRVFCDTSAFALNRDLEYWPEILSHLKHITTKFIPFQAKKKAKLRSVNCKNL